MPIRPAPLIALPKAVQHGLTRAVQATPLTLGAAVLDARLEGRLARAALHEVFADTPEDGAAAAGFAVLLALRGLEDDVFANKYVCPDLIRARASSADAGFQGQPCPGSSPGRRKNQGVSTQNHQAPKDRQPILWVREDRGVRRGGRLYPQGLAELGIDPAQVLTVHAPNIQALLRAGADIVKCGAVGAVVIEPYGKAPELDLTASRRLTLAAARSGVMTVALRVGAMPSPSAAESRWQVSAAPSTAIDADAPGQPAFDIELLRHRGGIAGFEARVEWNRDTRTFDRSPLPRGAPAFAAVGTGQADRRRTA